MTEEINIMPTDSNRVGQNNRGSALESYKSQIIENQVNIRQITTLVDRINDTIDKLTRVSSDISELLAVQSNRIDTLDKSIEKLISNQEKEQNISSKISLQLIEKIRETEKSLEKDINLLIEKKFLLLETKNEKFSTKISTIEKWIWLVSGGAMIAGFLLSKITSILLPKLF